MSSRTIYLRDRKNISLRKDGSYTRGNPICVIVSSIDRENNTVKFAIATAHKQDAFIKERGRRIAEGRLNTNPRVIPLPQDKSGHKITEAIIMALKSQYELGLAVENEEVEISEPVMATPHKVYLSAKRWLKQASQPKIQ